MEKTEIGRDREKRRIEERRIEESQKKEDTSVRKATTHCVSPMICGSRGSQSSLAKAAGGSGGCGARGTFPSQNAQNIAAPDHFWKFGCGKNARHCGAKRISKSKPRKHIRFGPVLDVRMSKKCMPLWHEAHSQVTILKARGVRTTPFRSCDETDRHADRDRYIDR